MCCFCFGRADARVNAATQAREKEQERQRSQVMPQQVMYFEDARGTQHQGLHNPHQMQNNYRVSHKIFLPLFITCEWIQCC